LDLPNGEIWDFATPINQREAYRRAFRCERYEQGGTAWPTAITVDRTTTIGTATGADGTGRMRGEAATGAPGSGAGAGSIRTPQAAGVKGARPAAAAARIGVASGAAADTAAMSIGVRTGNSSSRGAAVATSVPGAAMRAGPVL